MEIPYDVISALQERIPYGLNPILSGVLGLFHLFPLCCIASFVLAEIGITLETWFPQCDFSVFQRMESDYYDEERRMHLCCFHAQQKVEA